MNWGILLLVFIAGTFTSLQAGVNGGLGKKVGSIEAAFISFAVGTCFLLGLLIFQRKGDITQVMSVPKWQLTGGLLGALYILIMVTAVPRIGIAASLVTLIAGQLICSMLIDHFALMGGQQIPIDWKRLAGLALVAGAVYLFYDRS